MSCTSCGSSEHETADHPEHYFWDAATGHLMTKEFCCFAYEAYPERPCCFSSLAAAQGYLNGISGLGPHVLHGTNSNEVGDT